MPQSLSTEKAILLSAETEFMEKGFSGARTMSIAQAAGVTHAMLHYYFHTKEQLFEGVLTSKLTQIINSVFETLEDSNKDISVIQCIESFIRKHYQYLSDNNKMPLFVLNELVYNPDRIELLKTILSEKIKSVDLSFGIKYAEACADGVLASVELSTLIIDVLMLNLSSIVMRPLFQTITNTSINGYDAWRLEENITLIRKRINP